ncbi:hypothetical protein N7456_005987 [Penicillium angulare]|uniref:SAC3/GANP/THP3 conserved domain-containing protein n=1 Tax=Penicillium angulare TaxID=116970 RepID=A0A9W9G142_9EURO|nr:hypothetical protein N7456_005987 [Penicillium angulare]
MTSPAVNLFGTRGQRGGATNSSTTGRGRGQTSARGSQFQPKGKNSRGRGASQYRDRGRGRGASAGATPTGTPHSGAPAAISNSSQSQPTNSPFAQLNQNTPPSNPFGALQTETNSSFGSPGSAPITSQSTQNAKPIGQGRLKNVSVEDAAKQAQYHERYEQLKIARAKERQHAIKTGHMADPNKPTTLENAITPVGTCTSMCPEFERVERIVQKMVDKSEKYLHPSTGTLQNMETKMLKRFRRSAAGYDEQLPSDIRTPHTLLQTTNYLIRQIVGGSEPLGIVHKFVWDRTRSIRNDFSVQQVTQEDDVKTAVTCLERIARFHIVSLHVLSGPANEEPFDRHQEREQLNNTMLSLIYYYDDNRDRMEFPNEEEFRAYFIIFSIHDQRPDLEARVSNWPSFLLKSPRVKVALELYAAACNTWEYQGTLDARRTNAIAQGFYARFFNIINSQSVSYLMACVAEIYFGYARQTAIRTIWKGYCKTPLSQQHKNEEWTVEEMTKVLHFDDNEQTVKFCEEQDLQLAENADGVLYLNWGNRPVDSVRFSPSSDHAYSNYCVESKRMGRSLVSVILGMSVQEAAQMGMVDKSELHEAAAISESATGDKDDSLFVSAEGNSTPAPVVEPNTSTLESDHPMESPATNILNVFQKSSSPANGALLGADPSATPSSISTPQPPETVAQSPFASIFFGNSEANKAERTAPTGSTASPFAIGSNQTSASAPSQSVFSSPKPTEPPAASVFAPTTSNQPPAPSPFSGLFQPTSEPKSSTAPPNAFAASLSSFTSPQSSSPATQAATPAINPTAQQPTPLVPTANPFFSSSGTKDSSSSEAPAPPAPKTSSIFPGGNSLFSSTGPTPVSNMQDKFPKTSPAGSPASDSSPPAPEPASVFGVPSSTATAEPAAPSSASLFNFSKPAQGSTPPCNFPSTTSTPQPEAEPASSTFGVFSGGNSTIGGPQPSFFGGLSTGHDAAKKFTEDKPNQAYEKPLASASLFGPAPTAPLSFGAPTFQAPKPFLPFSSTPQLTDNKTKKPATIFPKPTTNLSGLFSSAPMNSTFAEDKTQSLASAPSEPVPATKQQGFAGSTGSLESSLSSRDSLTPSNKRKFTDGPPVYETEEEERAAWHRILHRVAEKQARKKAKEQARQREQEREQERERQRELEQANNRKRALEEAALEHSSEEPESKTLRLSDLVPNSAPPRKYSFAETYAKPLPTLPCLERFKASTERKEPIERKGPTDAEIEAAYQARRQLEIDQDELLLSACRIAAETLKNGPKIFDGYEQPASEYPRYSYSPHRSLSASSPYTRSMSPPEKPSHGYKVAYAPDIPGQPLSRTEQRIRRTGAHGLAFIPLDFSKTHVKSLNDKGKEKDKDKDKDKDKEEKDKFSQSR